MSLRSIIVVSLCLFGLILKVNSQQNSQKFKFTTLEKEGTEELKESEGRYYGYGGYGGGYGGYGGGYGGPYGFGGRGFGGYGPYGYGGFYGRGFGYGYGFPRYGGFGYGSFIG